MRKFYIPFLILFLILTTLSLRAQVGISNGNKSISASAMLDVNSTDKGILLPRLSAESRDGILSPAKGLIIYNTSSGEFNYFDGSQWNKVESAFVSAVKGTNRPGGGISISPLPSIPADSSAMLDIISNTRGVLFTRTTPASIANPDNGLIIYDITDNRIKYYIDNEWIPLCAIVIPGNAPTGTLAPAGVSISGNGATADHSAILDISSENKGILIPRLTVAQRDAILPVNGLTIFNIDSKRLEYYNGSYWSRMNVMAAAGVTILAGSPAVCAGTQVTFTASPINGGDTPAYEWFVNGQPVSGATGPVFTYTPADNDLVKCQMTSSNPCALGNPAMSNVIVMTVYPLLPVSISINTFTLHVCAGSSAIFTSSVTNGGPNPQYQWKINGNNASNATNTSFSYVPANGDVVTCELISDAICATGTPALSNSITLTVNPLLPVSITISESANNVCAGTSVTYTATPVNGGPIPHYQWKVNGNNVSNATNATFTYAPVNGDVVRCQLTSTANCVSGNPALSNSLTMTVNPLKPVSITIAASANPVCAGTQVTFTATPVNGGSNPQYQWKINANNISNATNATFTHVPVNGDVITCQLTSNITCATGNPALSSPITMTVNPLLPVSITIAESANPVCAGTQVTFTATTVNGGPNPQYQWKVNATNISNATNATFAHVPVNGDVITCQLTSNATCATGTPALSNAITMTVNPLLPVSITIAESANPVCAGTQVTFTSTTVNGGPNPQYQWKVNTTNVSNATNATFAYVPVNGDVITCQLTSDATCATGTPALSNPVTMTVNPLLPVSITIAESANPVCAGTQVTFTSTTVHGGPNPQYQWKVNATNVANATNATFAYVPVNGDVITCELVSDATCAIGTPAL
ncbi:MAG TPA: hypothetical protein PKG48_01855, partial [Bacteroidales bacterium]|nr:hypothetical protein [Bacteroidales bacterium]